MGTMKTLAVCGLCVMAAAPALAQEVGEVRLSFGPSALGITGEAAYRFTDQFSIRGIVGVIPTVTVEDVELEGEDFDFDVEALSGAAMFDYHTGLGGLRVSAGLFFTDPTITGTTSGTVSGTFEVFGETFTVQNAGEYTVSTRVTPRNDVSPALSIGYDHPLGDRFFISGEIGAIINGGYDVSSSSTVTSNLLTAADLATFEQTVQDEEQAIEDEINDTLGFYPYASIMIGLRF